MAILNWVTNNWVNILAFMGALNVLAQTLTRVTTSSAKEGVTGTAIHSLKAVASLGIHPPRAKGDDSVPV